MALRRIHHVALSVPEELSALTVHFYLDILGFDQLPVPDSLGHIPIIAWFQIGSDELHLLKEPSATGEFRRHLCFEVDDIEPFRAKLEAANIETDSGDPIPGRPRFFCADPAGNRLEFLEDHT